MQVKVNTFTKQILDKFIQNNFEIYLVGGAVRDILMEKSVTDWDFTTNATPEQILEIFPDAFYDNQFGTVGIVNPEEKKDYDKGKIKKLPIYEVTTFRKEYGYTNKRHPDKIQWGQTLEEVIERRDFTINAMALLPPPWKGGDGGGSPEAKIDFELIDHFHGQQDLENKIIRAVGNPEERFQEDALRMMRAVRQAAQLGFIIEGQTLAAIQKSARLIREIARERIRDELFKLLATDYAADGITILAGSGLMEYIIPELLNAQGVDQAGHHTEDVWRHSLLSLHHCPSHDPLVRLATLIHDSGKPYTRAYVCEKCKTRFKSENQKRTAKTPGVAHHKNTNKGDSPGVNPENSVKTSYLTCPHCGFENDYYASVTFYNHEMAGAKIATRIADRLRLSRKQKEKLVHMVRWHMFSVDERQTNKAVRRFIKNVGKSNLDDILALRTGDRLGGGARETSWRLERFKELLVEVQKQPFTLHDLQITGEEIMEQFKLKPGPEVGKILKQLYAEIADKKLENKHAELKKRIKELKQSS